MRHKKWIVQYYFEPKAVYADHVRTFSLPAGRGKFLYYRVVRGADGNYYAYAYGENFSQFDAGLAYKLTEEQVNEIAEIAKNLRKMSREERIKAYNRLQEILENAETVDALVVPATPFYISTTAPPVFKEIVGTPEEPPKKRRRKAKT